MKLRIAKTVIALASDERGKEGFEFTVTACDQIECRVFDSTEAVSRGWKSLQMFADCSLEKGQS